MKYEIDMAGLYNPDDLYDRLEEYIELPEYFGRNLDALHDVFSEIAEETEFIFTNVQEAEVMMSKYMRNFKRMCDALQKENTHLHLAFQA